MGRNMSGNGEALGAVQTVKVNVTPEQGMVLLELDLGIHMLSGIAHQVLHQLQQPTVAAEVQKALAHLQGVKEKFLREVQTGLVLASPADLPRG